MRILTVRLQYVYNSHSEEDPAAQKPVEKRRDRLSNLGFDVHKLDDDQLQSYPVIGMTDAQFVELSIAGEREMEILATCITEDA
jgi:hypothetical protein